MGEHADNLSRYVNYNVWANKAIADFLADKDASLLDKEIVSSFTSIRKTIFHIADGQYIWLARLGGSSPTEWPSKYMKPEEAVGAMVNTAMALALLCEERGEDFWTDVVTYTTMDGAEHSNTVGDIMMHLMNHGTFHRGQLITLFRQVGFEGKMPKTDFIAYLREVAVK